MAPAGYVLFTLDAVAKKDISGFGEWSVGHCAVVLRQLPEPTFNHPRSCIPPAWLKGQSNSGLRKDVVLMVDHLVGRIAAALSRNGLTEDTLFIVTSDNGARVVNYDGKDHGHRSNGDLRGGKGDIYDGGHREPFVAMWPKVIKPGTVSPAVKKHVT